MTAAVVSELALTVLKRLHVPSGVTVLPAGTAYPGRGQSVQGKPLFLRIGMEVHLLSKFLLLKRIGRVLILSMAVDGRMIWRVCSRYVVVHITPMRFVEISLPAGNVQCRQEPTNIAASQHQRYTPVDIVKPRNHTHAQPQFTWRTSRPTDHPQARKHPRITVDSWLPVNCQSL